MNFPQIRYSQTHGRYLCPECPSVFRKRFNCINHLRGCHYLEKTECQFCGAKVRKLKQHIRDVHDKGKFPCSHCQKSHSSERLLTSHLKHFHKSVHHGYVPKESPSTTCHICRVQIPKRKEAFHFEIFHLYPVGYQTCCPLCESQVKYLPWHVAKKHTDCSLKSLHRCRRCREYFLTEERLNSHITNHEEYRCVLCSTAFAEYVGLAKHMLHLHSKVFNLGDGCEQPVHKVNILDWAQFPLLDVTPMYERIEEIVPTLNEHGGLACEADDLSNNVHESTKRDEESTDNDEMIVTETVITIESQNSEELGGWSGGIGVNEDDTHHHKEQLCEFPAEPEQNYAVEEDYNPDCDRKKESTSLCEQEIDPTTICDFDHENDQSLRHSPIDTSQKFEIPLPSSLSHEQTLPTSYSEDVGTGNVMWTAEASKADNVYAELANLQGLDQLSVTEDVHANLTVSANQPDSQQRCSDFENISSSTAFEITFSSRNTNSSRLKEKFSGSQNLPRSIDGHDLSIEENGVLLDAVRNISSHNYESLSRLRVGQIPEDGKRTSTTRHRYAASRQPHLCPYCKAILRTKWSLKQHIQLKHLNIKRFNCDLCGKGFSSAADLRRHVDHSHVKSDAFEVCNICGIEVKVSYLRRHKQFKHEKREAPCPLCPNLNVYKSREAMLRHYRKTHGKGGN